MKKSFQLSAVAIAIAASSSVMAATIAQTGSVFVVAPTVNGINVNGTLTGPAIPGTSKTDNPFNVQFTGAVTINPADTDSAILTSVFGSQPVPASAAVTHNVDGTKTITYQVANNTIQTDSKNVNTSSQIINDQKVELSSGISTTKTESDFSGKTVTLKYTPTAAGSNNFVGSNPNPVVPTVINKPSVPLSQDSITVGKKVPGADNALTITKVDGTVTKESVVNASGILTTGTLNVGGDTTVAKLTANGSLNAKAGATVAGGLTADKATVNGLLDAKAGLKVTGDTTVAKLTASGDTDLQKTTVNGLLDAKAGLKVTGDTTLAKLTAGVSTLDSLTVNQNATVTGTLTAGASTLNSLKVTNAATVGGLLSANAGAAVTGGLTADTARVNGALTAGASTLDSLNVTNAATVNGLLSANGGANVLGGLTADTATVTGALIAGASTLDSLSVTNAATVNGLFTVNNDANVTGNLTAGSVKTSVVDLGTMSSTVTTNTAPSANRLTARYDTIDGNGSPITIYETQSGGVSTYYTINSGVATEYTDATVIGTLGNTVAPTAGGTTQTQSVLNTTTATVKEVTDKAVTYGEIKTQQDAVTVNGTLNNNENINVNVGTGAPVDVNNQSVVTGIIGTANGNNLYGTVATSKVTAIDGTVTADNTTTLTADGIVAQDTVSGKSTTISADGITTSRINGNGTNGALVLHGGTNSTTQTLDDNGVSFVTTDASGTVTGTTTIAADGTLTVQGVNVTGEIATNAANIATNAANIATNTADIATNAANIATNTADIATNKADIATNAANIATNTADIATNAANIATNTADIATNAANIATSTADIATNKADIATNKADIATNKADIAINAAAISSEAATREAADNAATTDRAAIRNEAVAEKVRVNKAIVDGDAATLTSANGYTDTKAAETLTSAKGYTDTTATTLRSEAAAETVRVNKAIVDGDAATLTSANGYTDTKAAATLTSANGYTDTKAAATLTSANGYTNTKAAETLSAANAYTNTRVNQLNSRVDDVQKTAYRGIAIALAAQQAVPNIAPGQVAVFGGVGHYEGETAGSIGVVTSFTDRISASGAFGFAGGNEFGGRVGVAYVFGGK